LLLVELILVKLGCSALQWTVSNNDFISFEPNDAHCLGNQSPSLEQVPPSPW